MKNYNVLLLATTGGFVPQFEMENVRILQELGATIHYAANFDNAVYHVEYEQLESMGIKLHNLDIHKSPFHLWYNGKAYWKLIKLVNQEKITCIHCHNPVGGVLGRLLGRYFKKKNLKIIYTVHGFHFYKGAPWTNWFLYYSVERMLARYTDILITINEEDYQIAKRFQLKLNGQVYKIPGVGIKRERLVEVLGAGAVLRKKYLIPKKAFHIISVGELNRNKNHEIIIRAMKQLQNTEIYYTICGEGIRRDRLQKFIRKMNLEDKVFMVGYQDEIAPFLQGADCFVFPSIREGLGMAALEAMALGLPVIATENRGTREYIEDGKNGYFCKWNDAEAFARAIQLLYENSVRCKEMGEYAKAASHGFDTEKTTEIMKNIYQVLLRR